MSLDDTAAPATPAESTQPALSTPVEAAPAAAAPEPDDDQSYHDDLSKVWEKNHGEGRARDEFGRFVSRETAETEDVEAPAEAAPEAVQAQEQPEAPSLPPAIEAPRAWTGEAKDKWASLPPEVQTYVSAREQEMQELRTNAGRLEAEYRPLKETLTRHQSYLSEVSHGDVAGYVDRVLNGMQSLDSNPAGTIKALADMYGVDLGQLYDPLAEPPNPQIVQAQRRIAALEAQLNSTQRHRAEVEASAQMAQVDQVLNEFFSKHPDAREIEDDFAAEIHAVRAAEPNLPHAALLEKAYERAAWANPAMRQKRIAAAQKADEAKRIAAAKEAAARAKQAASVNVNGHPHSQQITDDHNDSLRAIWRKNHAA